MSQLNMADDDVVIGYDPDSCPISPGWDLALVEVMRKDPNVNWSSLMSPRCQPELTARGYTSRKLDQIEVWYTKQAVVNSICAWRVGWLRRIGGLQEPNAFYGGLECSMYAALGPNQWAFLPGWWEDDRLRDGMDPEYRVWKWRHAHLHDWPGDFKSFLEAGAPLPPSETPRKLP